MFFSSYKRLSARPEEYARVPVLRMNCDSEIQRDANLELHFASIVFKLRADTPAKGIGLFWIGFR